MESALATRAAAPAATSALGTAIATVFRSAAWRAWVVLAIGLLATAGLWVSSFENHREASRQRFEVHADEIASRIVSRLRVYEQMLASGAGLFDMLGQVSRSQWRNYVGRLDLETIFPGVQSIGYVELVSPETAADFVARIRAQGLPSYDLQLESRRSVYAPILYVEPTTWRSQPAIGLDMMADPVRRSAMEEARDDGRASLSGEVSLPARETRRSPGFGFIMYYPVYRGGAPTTIEERRARIRGYTFARFAITEFMSRLLQRDVPTLRIQIFDGSKAALEALLYDSLAAEPGEDLGPALGFVYEKVLQLPERVWTARFTLLPEGRREYDSSQPEILALSGVAISALLFIITWSVTRSNERLGQQEAQYRYLFEKNPSVMWIYDSHTLEFLQVNEAAIDLFGYSRDEFLKMKLPDLHPDLEPGQLQEFIATLPPGLRRTGEWDLCTKDGRTVVVDISSYSMRYAGHDAAMVSARDVTDRRRAQAALAESEERFHNMADSMPAMLWLSNAQSEITFVNRYAAEYAGSSAEKAFGRGWLDIVHPEDRHYVVATIRSAVAGQEPFTAEFRLRRADGVYRWFVDRGIPRFSATGEYLGYIGVLFDITEQKDAQAQLQQAQKMESIGRLTGGIAHDFNNLLTVIEGSAELIAGDTTATPEQRNLAQMAFTAADRAAELTRSMLAFARRQTLTPKIVDINQVIGGMEGMLRRVLGEDIEISLAKAEALWPALVDVGRLENAVLNLAVNARDAMSKGGRLTIMTANVALDEEYASQNSEVQPGDYVLLAVSDTGTGMPPDVLQRVFEPYFTTKPVGSGTGLGLSMVFGFVKQSGGHIKAESELGLGTTMKIYLPRADLRDAARRAGAPREKIVPGTETILVAEDDVLVRSYVENQLRSLGYTVIATPDGPSALRLVEAGQPFDLLLTDVVMPGGLSGRDLAERTAELRPGVKVLYMSGYAETALTHQGRLEPGVHLLNKPFRRRELAAKVREVLDS